MSTFIHSFRIFIPLLLPWFPQSAIPCMPIPSHSCLGTPQSTCQYYLSRPWLTTFYTLTILKQSIILQLISYLSMLLQSVFNPPKSHQTSISSWYSPTFPIFSYHLPALPLNGQNWSKLTEFGPTTPHSCSWRLFGTTTLPHHDSHSSNGILANQL